MRFAFSHPFSKLSASNIDCVLSQEREYNIVQGGIHGARDVDSQYCDGVRGWGRPPSEDYQIKVE
jgi:hypothetical protein